MNKEEYNYLQEILQLPSEAADLLRSSDEESSVASSAEEDVLPNMDFLDRCAT